MEKPKCPPGYLLYADPATGKDKCIKTSDFYKDLEKDMGGKKGINKIIYNRSPKGRTKLAKTGGLVKAKEGMSVKKGCPRGQCGTPPNCRECADKTRVSTSGPKKTIPSLPTKIQPKTNTSKSTVNSKEKPTADSTKFYKNEAQLQSELAAAKSKYGLKKEAEKSMTESRKAYSDASRQQFKGKPGFDKNGFRIKKSKVGGTVKPKKKK
jgi:hypothetical protein